MSGDARQEEVEDLEAIHSENEDGPMPIAEIHSKNEDGPMPQQEVEDGSRWITETEWTQYIQEDPDRPHLRDRSPSDVSIFRVPNLLKDTQTEAYVPRRVSLGPLHYRSAELRSMGHHKGRALRRMMRNYYNENDLNDMDFANRAMQGILNMDKEIRDMYEENIDCDGETLARMLCLDGCFLPEVLRTLAVDQKADRCYDPIFGERKLSYAAKDVLMDIWLLENQIPFIVLLKLLQLKLNSGVDNVHVKLLDLLAESIASCGIPFDNKNLDIKQGSSLRHLLDFLHAAIASPLSEEQRVDEGCNISIGCCSAQCSTRLQCKSKERNDTTERIASPLSEEQRVDEGCSISIGCCSRQCSTRPQCKSKERNDIYRIPHAVELRNAGIKFSALQEGCIKQIKFDENSATIFLPPISIIDETERVFRNLIAYEMCKPSEINYVSSYAALMNDLIDTEQDVALMRRMGVLKNWLGSDKEVAHLFNGLGKEVTVSMETVFDNLAEKVNAHYNNEIKVQIEKLVQDHFSSPWTALALTAASVILVLTVLQTIYTIISTYKK